MTSPIKFTIKAEIISWLAIAVSLAASFYFYAHFPAKVATHWDFAGQPNQWSCPAFAAFFFPALIMALYILFAFIPYLDPRKDRYAEFAKVYNIFRNFFVVFLALIYFIVSLHDLGYNLDIVNWIDGLVGLLFILMGNYLGKIKPNWFVGIRTPWTLSSETVWNKTHRFGGKVFIFGGIIMIIAGFAPLEWRLPLFIADIIILVFGTIIYSFVVYSQEKRNKS